MGNYRHMKTLEDRTMSLISLDRKLADYVKELNYVKSLGVIEYDGLKWQESMKNLEEHYKELKASKELLEGEVTIPW
jgi:hypothetical protein